MKITIKIPEKSEILKGGIPVSVDSNGKGWSKKQLGDYANKSGVYVHHTRGKILYVGITIKGDYGNFGERFRREFQKKASSNSGLYRLLNSQKTKIKTYLFGLDDINKMIQSSAGELTKSRKALLFEQVLIGLFEPEGNKK